MGKRKIENTRKAYYIKKALLSTKTFVTAKWISEHIACNYVYSVNALSVSQIITRLKALGWPIEVNKKHSANKVHTYQWRG